jgi:hypothetical protein
MREGLRSEFEAETEAGRFAFEAWPRRLWPQRLRHLVGLAGSGDQPRAPVGELA